MTTSYNDGSHDPSTGAYIKPEDRASSIGNTASAYDPATDPRITHSGTVSVGTSSFDYDGTEYISAGSTASYDAAYIHNVSTAGTAYDDPAYYASAVDFNVDTMGTTTYPVPTATVDLSEVLAKLDDLSTKVEHLLEHAHTPLSGFIHLNPPSKTGTGKTE